MFYYRYIVLCLSAFSILLIFPNTAFSQNGRSKTLKLTKKEKRKVEELKMERDIGRNMAGRLLQFYGVYEDPALTGYVNQVGSYVASYSDDPERRYMFEIIDTDIVNAFASPGGYILVTLGAIRHCKNEAELAAVLSHEIAHVHRKHMLETIKNMSKEELEETVKEAEKNIKLAPSVSVRKRVKPEGSDTGAMLARYLSGSVAGLSLLAAAKAGMSLLLEKGLKPEYEYDADKHGVKTAINAGYHPSALNNYLCRLEHKMHGIEVKGKCKLVRKKSKKKNETILEKTHPPIIDRVASIKSVLSKMSADEIVGAKGVKRFKRYHKTVPPERYPGKTKSY